MMRALVVDDHEEVADFIAEALREFENMEVDVAPSAESAEALSARKDYDLYLVDLYLKGGDFEPDGLAFVKKLREQAPESRVILMTGKSYSKIITDVVIRTGKVRLIAKPIDLQKLLTEVRQAFAGPPEEADDPA